MPGTTVLIVISVLMLARGAKVREFSQVLPQADTGVLFYAGHGLQVAGRNYLLPVDARLQTERDLDFETVSLDFVLRQMELDRDQSLAWLRNAFELNLRGSIELVATRGDRLALVRARASESDELVGPSENEFLAIFEANDSTFSSWG